MSNASTGVGSGAPLLEEVLRDVSRSFFLTLRMLPCAVRSQISLAYLIARAADTIADTEVIPCEHRLDLLQALRQRIRSNDPQPLDLGALIQKQGRPSERLLLERIEEGLSHLGQLSQEDQQRVRQVLDMITSGQVLDLQRFGQASASQIQSLSDDDELDDYIYRVAGCVGEFWTKMCRAHLVYRAELDDAALLAQGIRFGKGLQLTNILRDLPHDLRRGRCYLPRKRLTTAGLTPRDLLDSASLVRFQPIYHHYLSVAKDHLKAGWDYTNRLPWSFLRLRLACSWPILIGLKTLNKLAHGKNILTTDEPIKISRGEVRFIILRSLISYPVPSAWRSLADFSR